jgi:hypothetical protein
MSTLTGGATMLAGLGNQARREASMWWSTGRWLRQALVWTFLLAGLLTAMLWVLPAVFADIDGAAMTDDAVQVAAQFTELAAFISAVGVVILVQGVLLDDQRSGLTEWLLSKPLSRPGGGGGAGGGRPPPGARRGRAAAAPARSTSSARSPTSSPAATRAPPPPSGRAWKKR